MSGKPEAFCPYAEFGVTENTDDEVIKAAYRTLSKKYHPDRNDNPDVEKMQRITLAYSILNDPLEKANHNCHRCHNTSNGNDQFTTPPPQPATPTPPVPDADAHDDAMFNQYGTEPDLEGDDEFDIEITEAVIEEPPAPTPPPRTPTPAPLYSQPSAGYVPQRRVKAKVYSDPEYPNLFVILAFWVCLICFQVVSSYATGFHAKAPGMSEAQLNAFDLTVTRWLNAGYILTAIAGTLTFIYCMYLLWGFRRAFGGTVRALVWMVEEKHARNWVAWHLVLTAALFTPAQYQTLPGILLGCAALLTITSQGGKVVEIVKDINTSRRAKLSPLDNESANDLDSFLFPYY